LTKSETEIRNIWSNWTDKLTEPCFYHSIENDKISISPASHFLKFLFQPAFTHLVIDFNGVRESLRLFDTFAKPLKPTRNPSFAKEPNFARLSLYWRFFDFQIKPKIPIFGKNWVRYA